MQDTNLIYKRLEELLPDFVFGTLSEDDLAFFIENYEVFPDLVSEVKQAKSFFNRLESMDFDKVFAEHTRNTSVGVLQKLSNKSDRKTRSAVLNKLLFPSVGLVLLLVVALSVFKNPENRIIQINHSGMERLSNPINTNELDDFNGEGLLSFARFQSILSHDANIFASNVFASDDDSASTSNADMLLDDYDNTIKLAYNQSPELFWGTGRNSNITIVNEIKNMSEEDFQNLLEEMGNNEN